MADTLAKNEIILTIITIIHMVLIFLILFIPFSNDNYLLSMYLIIIPFIVLHWVLNNNTCCLTVAEKYFREQSSNSSVDMDDCLTYKLIAPVYDFKKNNEDFSTFIYSIVAILWGITAYKVYGKIQNNEINSIYSIFKGNRI